MSDKVKHTYRVKTPVRHDGVQYGIGTMIELDNEQAKRLIDIEAIEIPMIPLFNSPLDSVTGTHRNQRISEQTSHRETSDIEQKRHKPDSPYGIKAAVFAIFVAMVIYVIQRVISFYW